MESDESTPITSANHVEIYSSVNCDNPSNSIESQSKLSKWWKFTKSLTIEPVMFLFMFALILTSTCLTNMIMDKGCLFYLKYSPEICKNLSNHQNENDNVIILANNYNLYLNLLSPIGAFIVIFLAPWSDKHGRKPPLTIALFGFFIYDLGIILCTIYFESRIEYILVSNLATQFTGGFICVMTIIYSHSAEVSSSQSRAFKYTTLQIAFGVAVTLGAFAGGKLYQDYGYMTVFTTVACCHLAAMVWVVAMVEETQGVNFTCRQKTKDLCAAQNFSDGLQACIKRREDKGRLQLWLLLFSSCTIALTYEVYTNIAYLYAHRQFKWGPTTYSMYWTGFSFSEMVVVMICGPLFTKVFNFSDPLIGLIGTVSIMGKNIFLAMANQLWLYYASNIFGFLNGLGNLAIRSLISKLVDEDEAGRVFSFLATCEAIVPLIASAVIAQIFNATVKTFPGTCYFAATLFLFIPLGTFSWRFKVHRQNRKRLRDL